MIIVQCNCLNKFERWTENLSQQQIFVLSANDHPLKNNTARVTQSVTVKEKFTFFVPDKFISMIGFPTVV